MKKLAHTCPSWALAALLLTGACAQVPVAPQGEDRGPALSQERAAEEAMQALAQLAGPSNFASMGFDAAIEVQQARAGLPVVQRTVSYDRLLAWSPGITLDTLLDPLENALYPVEIDGTAKTSFTLEWSRDGWRIATLGDRSESATLRRVKALRNDGADVRVLSVPGLNLEFLQVTQGSAVLLTVTRDAPELQWKEGESRTVQDGLRALSDHARAFEKQYGPELSKHRLAR